MGEHIRNRRNAHDKAPRRRAARLGVASCAIMKLQWADDGPLP